MRFIKIFTFFFLIWSIQALSAQSILFEVGQTSSGFTHNSASGPEAFFFSDKGQVLKVSFIQDFLKTHEVSFGASLFEANSLGQVITTELDYRTQFLGVFALSHFNVLSLANRSYCASCTDFNFYLNAGVQFSSLLSGTQKINTDTYNLRGIEDFKGIWFSPILGTKVRFDASDIISLILTYNYIPMLNVTDTEEDFKINSNQLTIGVRLWL
ncbi:MAG: hypothetical protein ACPF9U_07370 [Flavobacteriaceae bacterium]